MKHQLFLVAILALFGFGCRTGDISRLRPSATSTELDLADVASMTTAEEELDVNENFELSTHTTYFATSADGVSWTLQEDPIAHYASVPDVVRLTDKLGPFPADTLLVYFVDGTQDHGKEDLALGLVYSLDGGDTWSDRLYTDMEGAPANTIVVDPSLVELPDGKLRLYFFDFETTPGFSGQKKTYAIHSAVSEDGVNFVYEGVVFESDGLITDPDLTFWNDEWYMYTMSQERVSMQVGVSADPLKFEDTQKVNNRGIPGVIPVDDEMWLYSCGDKGITRLTSSDGVTFDLKDDSVVSVEPGVHCDPSVVKTKNGYAMVFKHIRAEDLKMRRP